MFELRWREHKSHEWILEGRFLDVRAALVYLSTDSPVLVGQYKLTHGDNVIEILSLDMTAIDLLETLRTKLSQDI